MNSAGRSSLSAAHQPGRAAPGNAAVRPVRQTWRQTVPWLLWLIGLLVLGALLRATAANAPLWVDELHTSWVVADGLADVAERAWLGNNTPLYFWGLRMLTWPLGHTEITLRAPSMLAGLCAIALGGTWVYRQTAQTAPAALTAGLIAVGPHALFYSLEARTYGLVALGGLWLTILLDRLAGPTCDAEQPAPSPRPPSWRRRMGYWFTATVLFWLHYTAALLPVAHAVWLGTRTLLGRPTEYRWPVFLRDSWPWALSLLVAWPQLAALSARRHAWSFVDRPSLIQLFDLFPLLWFVGPTAIALVVQSVARQARQPTAPAPVPPPTRTHTLGLALAWLCLPLGMAAIATWCGWPVFLRRYLAVSLYAPAVVTGLLLARCRRPGWQWLVGSLTLIAVFGGIGPGYRWSQQRQWVERAPEDWRATQQFLTAAACQSPRPATVWLDAGLIEAPLWLETSQFKRGEPNRGLTSAEREYLLFPLAGIYQPPIPLEQMHPVRWQSQCLVGAPLHADPPIWLVVRGRRPGLERGQSLPPPPHTTGKNWLQVVSLKHFGTIYVAQLRVLPAAEKAAE